MAIKAVTLTESYSRTYYVEADSYDEAKEKLDEAIREGKVDGPDECCSVEYKDDTDEYNGVSPERMKRLVDVE